MKLEKSGKNAIAAMAKSLGVPADRISAALSAMDGVHYVKQGVQPIAVPQARVCEMLSCSRHHVRKLVRQGLLRTVTIGGLTRYPVDSIMNLLTSGNMP
jgi:hypothetical protein